MVAAWMSAETGVGPSMASSSQACSGTWADLPQAPISSRTPMVLSVASEAPLATSLMPLKLVVPKVTNMRKMARLRPMSPTRLMTKAFFAAAAAEGLCCQKPMSR